MTDDWEPAEWWRVVDLEGEIWAETSDKEDAIARMRPGDTLEQQFKKVYQEWRTVAV
jgi:hypothetical protein